jgi:hypothetical protein
MKAKCAMLLFTLMFALIFVSPVFAQTQMQCHPIVNGAQLASDELVIGDKVCRKVLPSGSASPTSAPPITVSEGSPRAQGFAERPVAKADTPMERANTPIKAAAVRPTTVAVFIGTVMDSFVDTDQNSGSIQSRI